MLAVVAGLDGPVVGVQPMMPDTETDHLSRIFRIKHFFCCEIPHADFREVRQEGAHLLQL